MTRAFYAFAVLLYTLPLLSQTADKSFTVKFTSEIPIVDGILDEPLWKTADGPHDFQQFFPSDSILAENPTDIKMVYSDTHLYIGITVQSIGDKWITPSLKRDFRASNGDSMSLVFDTFNDGTNRATGSRRHQNMLTFLFFFTIPYGVMVQSIHLMRGFE